MIKRGMAILAVAAVVAATAGGCASQRDTKETLRLGRAGIAMLVDSSVYLSVAGGRDSISVPENAILAVEMERSAKESLARRGYTVSGASLLSVGAPFALSDTMSVITVAGVLTSPETVGKPFIVRPYPGDMAVNAKVNDLFLWSRDPKAAAPKGSLDILQSPGLLLVSCRGANKQSLEQAQGVSITSLTSGREANFNAWSEILVMLIDRASGKIVWLGKGSVSRFTPESAAREVSRLLAELPTAK